MLSVHKCVKITLIETMVFLKPCLEVFIQALTIKGSGQDVLKRKTISDLE